MTVCNFVLEETLAKEQRGVIAGPFKMAVEATMFLFGFNCITSKDTYIHTTTISNQFQESLRNWN